MNVPKQELIGRMNRFKAAMDADFCNWEICAVTGAVNLYYLTGTICDGALFVRRGGDATLWVRRSYERAMLESEFADIRPMASFREVAAEIGPKWNALHLDTANATLEWYGLLCRYFSFGEAVSLDQTLKNVRAVKSEYEIERVSRAGRAADHIFTNLLPGLLREGVSEAELGGELYALFIKHGHQGLSRFAMRNTEVVMGHIGFGGSSLYPSLFNGASGLVGICPASPVLGSPNVLLKKGDLVYIDLCFGVEGYHIDKTQLYSFGSPQPMHVVDAHRHCLDLQRLAASLLTSGNLPSDVYAQVLSAVPENLRPMFMGMPGRNVPFIGHGVGLFVDEMPVIAGGFSSPLKPGMTIALEPKLGLSGHGIIGSENTYLVTSGEALSLTGELKEIIDC